MSTEYLVLSELDQSTLAFRQHGMGRIIDVYEVDNQDYSDLWQSTIQPAMDVNHNLRVSWFSNWPAPPPPVNGDGKTKGGKRNNG